jgi:hypothetical protein
LGTPPVARRSIVGSVSEWAQAGSMSDRILFVLQHMAWCGSRRLIRWSLVCNLGQKHQTLGRLRDISPQSSNAKPARLQDRHLSGECSEIGQSRLAPQSPDGPRPNCIMSVSQGHAPDPSAWLHKPAVAIQTAHCIGLSVRREQASAGLCKRAPIAYKRPPPLSAVGGSPSFFPALLGGPLPEDPSTQLHLHFHVSL